MTTERRITRIDDRVSAASSPEHAIEIEFKEEVFYLTGNTEGFEQARIRFPKKLVLPLIKHLMNYA